MTLVCRTLLAGLVVISLCAAAGAQSARPADDPRNQSPAGGSGGLRAVPVRRRPSGTFGLTAGGNLFGFPGFNAQLGPPTGGHSNFGSAAFFPGIGSPIGSILPGVVLATTALPATALTLPITVPVSFTTQPSYLPDAPFVNRLYGESTFDDFVVGAKLRFNGINKPWASA